MRKRILLMEICAMRYLLLEDRIEFLRNRFLGRIEAANLLQDVPNVIRADVEQMEGKRPAEKTFNYVMQFDPDATKKHVQWMLTLLLKGAMRLEDLPSVRDDIVEFNRVKRHLPTSQRDINRFKTPGDLEAALAPFANKDVVSKRESSRRLEAEMLKQSTVLLDNATYRVLIPRTKEASCFFGVNTRWCTAATKGTNLFDYYASHPLYIILHKPTNRRWQFHFWSGQFKDERDRQIDLNDFCDEHPQIEALFNTVHDAEPIATYRDWYIYKDQSGIYPFSKERGLRFFQSQHDGYLRINDAERSLEGIQFPNTRIQIRDPLLIDALNSLNIERVSPSAHSTLLKYEIFFNFDEKRFGVIEDIANDTISAGSTGTWYIIEMSKSEVHYYLIDARGDKKITAFTSSGSLVAVPRIKNATKDKDLMRAYAKLIAERSEIRKLQLYEPSVDGLIHEANIPDDILRIIAQSRPDVLTIPTMARVFGNTDRRVLNRIHETFHSSTYSGDVLGDDRIVTETLGSLLDIENVDDPDALEALIAEATGDSQLKEDAISARKQDKLALLSSLSEEVLHLLSRHFEERHGIKLRTVTPNSVLKVHEHHADDMLEDAFKLAMRVGIQAAARKKARDILTKAIEDHPYLVMKNNKKWEKAFKDDSTCGLAVPIDVLVEKSRYANRPKTLNQWLRALQAPLRITRIDDLYAGYDQAAAERAFRDRVRTHFHHFARSPHPIQP